MTSELHPKEYKLKKVKTEERYMIGGSFTEPTRFDFKFLSEYKKSFIKISIAFVYDIIITDIFFSWKS